MTAVEQQARRLSTSVPHVRGDKPDKFEKKTGLITSPVTLSGLLRIFFQNFTKI